MFYRSTINRKKVAEILKDAIKRRYKSIAEYARLTEQEYKKVHSWTRGKRLPGTEDFVANCLNLKVPVEYMLVGTNKEAVEGLEDEDEYGEMARYTYPNLIFADVALVLPLLETATAFDIICRAGDNWDSTYIYDLVKKHIRVESDAWKYCIYELQQRDSPLVSGLEKLEVSDNEDSDWCERYFSIRREWFEQIYLLAANKEKV